MSRFHKVATAALLGCIALFGGGCALNLNTKSGQLTLQPTLERIPSPEAMRAGCLTKPGEARGEIRVVMNEISTTTHLQGTYLPC